MVKSCHVYPMKNATIDSAAYHHQTFESGDAEMLYNMIRHFKPKRIVEIGCGQSTLFALLAENRNRQDDHCARLQCTMSAWIHMNNLG